jgi:hypothetical protein
LAALVLALRCAGQVQVAGTLLVNVDPAELSLGPVFSVTNSGALGGVFQATGLATVSQPMIIAAGGGANGIMFDGNNFMEHYSSGGVKQTLPAALSGVNAPYSIECWVVNPCIYPGDATTMVYWGVRNTFGAQTSFSYSAHISQGAMDHWVNNLNWLLVPAPGVWHHLVYTFDGTTQRAYVDGGLNTSATILGNLNPNTSQPITLAAERNSDGSLVSVGWVRGRLTLGKVRIHSGVLADAQVAANYNLEKPTFAMAPAFIPVAPIHRYHFNNPVSSDATGATIPDIGTPGGSNGVVIGSAGLANFNGSRLTLYGGSSGSAAYVALPPRTFSSLSVSNGGSGRVTVEGWVNVAGGLNWMRLFDFGTTTIGQVTNVGGSFNGVNFFILAQNGTSRDWARCEVSNNGYNGGPNAASIRDFGLVNDNSKGLGLSHYAVTWDESTGEVIVYVNGLEATRFTTTARFNSINDQNMWLGRSNWSGDNNLQGSYYEFRMYNVVLTPAQVQKEYQSGPNSISLDPGALQAIHLQLPHTKLVSGVVDQLSVSGDYPSLSNVVQNANAGFVFATSDPTVVTVSPSGLLQAVSNGTANVTATLGSLTDTQVVSVVGDPGVLQAVRLALTNRLALYDSVQAQVRGDFANVNDVDLLSYGAPTFTSSQSNILAVSSAGRVTAVGIAAGGGATATITANYGGLGSSKAVTVSFPANRFTFDTGGSYFLPQAFGFGFWGITNNANSNVLMATSTSVSQALATNMPFDLQFELLYNYQNSTFRVRNRTTGRCLGTQSGGTVAGTKVVPVIYTALSSQQWYLTDAGNDWFRFVNAASGRVMQTDNANPATITIADLSASPAQLWMPGYQTHYPKKGTAGYGDFNSRFQQSWAYNWGSSTSWSLPATCVFHPMRWNTSTSIGYDWTTTPKPLCLMGYNEPDNSSQANLTTATAISDWPNLLAKNVPLMGPGCQNTLSGWDYDFNYRLAAYGYRSDYAAIHQYPSGVSSSSQIGVYQSEYNAFGKPVFVTEWSIVDWSGTHSWSENDCFNCLAEILWQAEDQIWLKGFGLFPFSGTPPANPWTASTPAPRSDTFQADGTTFTPFGELYAAWDADRTLHGRTPYLIQNLATSFRLSSSNSTPLSASSIRVRDATTEWALVAAPTLNHWYIISLADGRRLRDQAGALNLAPWGTTGSQLEWNLGGPDGSGYYYISNQVAAHNLNGSGTAPAITFNLVSASTLSAATRWRCVKPYLPVAIPSAVAPTGVSATASNTSVSLQWAGSANDRYYYLYRSTVPGGPYTRISSNLAVTSFVDNAVTNYVTYYYVVSGLNILAEESSFSAEVNAQPQPLVSTTPVQLVFSLSGGQLQLTWPADHIGWRLQAQTNTLDIGLATNWATVPGSSATNLFVIPIDAADGSVFYRLVYP